MSFVKTGDAQILSVLPDLDEEGDKKTKKALEEVKKVTKDGNKTELNKKTN